MPQVLNGQLDEGMAGPILEVRDLSISYRESAQLLQSKIVVKALRDVSFSITQGETLAVVGESGSGKTTLARGILRLVPPTAGSISYNGVDITSLSGRALQDFRRDVQIVYQDPYESLNPRQDVATALSIPIRHLRGEKDKEVIHKMVDQLLREVGLRAEMRSRLPHQLSGGERQRVNIARALASNPRVLVADEPITMLDASQRLRILRLLLDLKEKRNLTVLLITHDLASARIVSDEVIVMYLGRVVEMGASEDVFSTPHHPYVELMHQATPILRKDGEERDESVEQSLSFPEQSQGIERGCAFRPRCKYATKICEEVEPDLLEKSKGHLAACHNPP